MSQLRMSRLAEQYLDLFAAFEPRFSMRTRSTIAASTSGAGAART